MYSRPALATRRDSTRLDWAVQTSPPSTVRGAAPRPSMARCVHGTSHHRSSSKPCEHDRPDQRARGQPVLYGPAHHRLFELPSGAVSSPVCTSGDLRARARVRGEGQTSRCGHSSCMSSWARGGPQACTGTARTVTKKNERQGSGSGGVQWFQNQPFEQSHGGGRARVTVILGIPSHHCTKAHRAIKSGMERLNMITR